MEWKDVYIYFYPAGITGIALVAGRWLIPTLAMYGLRCRRDRGTMFSADAYLGSSVQAGNHREAVEVRFRDIVANHTAIRFLALLAIFRHTRHVSFQAPAGA